jgi:glycosidase
MLNAQFDFNIYHTAIDVLGEREGHSMRDLARTIEESGAAYGAHHTMGNISGNHDKTRFISLAGGAVSWDEDGKAAGWTRHVGIGDSVRAYSKALLLEKLNLTLPGVPCIYQGDEYGEVGANDPDNRHMMRFETLSLDERNMREKVTELIHMRRNSMPLLYGELIPLIDRPEEIIYQRVYLGEKVTVIINRKNLTYEIIEN